MQVHLFTRGQQSTLANPLISAEGRASAAFAAGLEGVETVPFFHAAWLFAAGVFFAQYEWIRPGWMLICLLLMGGVCLLAIYRARRLAWLSLAVLWCFLGAWCAEMEPHPVPSPALATLSDGLTRSVEGTVVAVASVRSESEENLGEVTQQAASQRVDLQLSSIEFVDDKTDRQIPIEGLARLNIRWPVESTPTTLHCGDHIRADARLLIPETYHDAGVWSRENALLDKGVLASAKVSGPTVERLPTVQSTGLFVCRLSEMQYSASTRLLALTTTMESLPPLFRLTHEDAAMLAAMVAGDRSYLTHTIRIDFERTGSFHMLVVSGFHLAVVASFIFWIARRLRLSQTWATFITLAASLGYALFTGFALPVQRSLWMVSVYMLGRLLFRQRSPLNTIGFAALVLLALSPRSVFESSFQMTLLSVLTIAGIAYPLLKRTVEPYRLATKELGLIELDGQFPQRAAEFRIWLRMVDVRLRIIAGSRLHWRWMPSLVGFLLRCVELLVVGLVVELALTLPMATYFHRVTVFALPANLLMMPLLTLLIPVAMTTLAIALIWPAAALLPAMGTALLLHIDVGLVRFFSGIGAGDLRIATPRVYESAVFCLLLALAIWLAGRGAWSRRIAWLALLVGAVVVVVPKAIDHPHGALLVEAIDVGQGDSILLITPDGKTLLVDAGGFGGGPRHAPQEFDIGEDVVSLALWSRGIQHLDVVALSHAHSDHVGGLPAVLRNFHPTELWVGQNPLVPEYRTLLDEAHQLGVKVRPMGAGDQLRLGDVSVQVFAPMRGYQPRDEPTNNDSLVLRVAYGATSVMLEGDAEASVEQAMLSEPGLESTLLKVGHHGSLSSSQPAFIARVAPRWAVISCGLNNRYHHPRGEVLAELEESHIRTFSTDINGATCFYLDGKQGFAEQCNR